MKLILNIPLGLFFACILVMTKSEEKKVGFSYDNLNNLMESFKIDKGKECTDWSEYQIEKGTESELKLVLGVRELQCNYRDNPMGINNELPLLSWQIISNQRNVNQSAYEIMVSDDSAVLRTNKGNIWESGKILSKQSLLVKYKGLELLPEKKYYWKVRIWDDKDNRSDWSDMATWQTGLFSKEDWGEAVWIGRKDSTHESLPILRKEFNVKKTIKQATVYVSGLGHFELSLNGKKVGDHFLDPGWTDYNNHALYVTFDLTNELTIGKNAMGVMLGNGFYHIPPKRYTKFIDSFGYPKMICRLFIEYDDGTSESIVSDNTWKTSAGPITFSSIYGGEDYDARKEQIGWDNPEFQDASWLSASEVKGPPELNPQIQEPLKVLDSFQPVKITAPQKDIWIYDMGQNASGIPKIRVSGKRGDSIKITPGELLDDNGLVTQQASGGPMYFIYTLKGVGEEVWQPKFTYYGFRYLQVEGALPSKTENPHNIPMVTDIFSLHTRNSAQSSGEFMCSNDLLNKTYRLINWAIKSNMASVSTDCPHREKLGWLEQSHLMGSSVRYNYQIANFLKKIILDMKYSQLDNGLIPDIAPEYVEFEGGFRDSPEWGSSGIILPWYLYQWYGDKETLRESYPMMRNYAKYLTNKAQDHILSHGLGDWFDIGPEQVGESQLTPKEVTATAIYYYDLQILIKTAELLGENEDKKMYSRLGKKVRKAFNTKFYNKETKEYATGSQTSNAIAVFTNLVEPKNKEAVVLSLINNIREMGNRITAGDVGFRYVLRVLEQENRSDVIYDMNKRSDVPGYGYQLERGATSLTESWQAYRFVSNNHMMLGHLMEWFYSGLAGIRAADDAISFNLIEIRPEPVGDITSAKAIYKSPYGPILSEWNKNINSFQLKVEVPPNTKATVYLPASIEDTIFESGEIVTNYKIQNQNNDNSRKIIEVGSGSYNFTVQ